MIKVEAAGTVWWGNFINHLRHPVGELSYEEVDDALRKWGARDIKESKYIEFENKQAYTLFLLRWL